ncbi:MAG: oxidoreductase [Rariglobus sp.]|jgi:NAD(P)-dependent dehydrogenase (short-subunit alcohol dehydrogenase family)|nr:oxidoreductase [Rariglobus sp.]
MASTKTPVILITGASQGIGAAIAKVFAKELHRVRLALVARNARNLATVARACTKLGATVEVFTCDVADEIAVEALEGAVTTRFGAVDVLVNNAGVFAAAPFVQTSVAEFDRIVATNLRSAFLMTRAFVPMMVRQRHGDVFFMSSIAGLDAYPNSAAYCAAKFGVTGLAKVLRAETKDHGVRVCCVHPGATWSPSWSGSGVAEERIMPAADVARAFFDIYRLGRNTVVEEIVLRPQPGDL